MAKTFKAPFTQNGKSFGAVTTAAKTTFNDTANAVLAYTIGSDGALLRSLKARARANYTATLLMAMLTKASDASNTNPILLGTVLTGAGSIGATNAMPAYDIGGDIGAGASGASNQVRFEAGDKIWVASSVALAGGWSWHGEVEEFA